MLNIKSINQLIIYGIILVVLLTSFFTFIIINNAYNEFQEKITIIEDNYFKKQKEMLKNDIESSLKFIKYMNEKYKGIKTVEEIQKDVLDGIDKMQDKMPNADYIFIYRFDGTNLYDPIQKDHIGENLLDYKDPNGFNVIRELIHMSKYRSGGYVEYSWKKPGEDLMAPKISFAKSFKEWGWTLGKGVYLDNLKKVIKEKQEEYDQKISKYIIQILSLTLLLVFNSIFIYRYATYLIAKEIKLISGFLDADKNEYIPINQNKIYFKEFRSIVKYANDLISKVKSKTHNLEEEVHDKEAQLSMLLAHQEEFIKKSIHEINTPLSIIQMNIDLLKMKNIEDKHITNIETGSKIIHNIYNDLSYLIKKDIVEYKKREIDFSEYLKARIEFFNQIAEANMLYFVTNIQKDIFIKFNDTELQRIIDNNISNAIKYSFKDSAIFINLIINKEIIFEVKSHSPEIIDKEKIFTNYYRENTSRGGFGLGLNIVKEICDKNFVIISLSSNKNETKFTYRFKNENITS